MGQQSQFDEVLEAVDALPDEAQAELVDVIQRRLAERGRQRVVEDVRQAREEFAKGQFVVTDPDQLMREIRS